MKNRAGLHPRCQGSSITVNQTTSLPSKDRRWRRLTPWVWVWAPLHRGCESLCNLLTLSVLQSPSLENGNTTTCVVGLWEFDEFIFGKIFKECLSHMYDVSVWQNFKVLQFYQKRDRHKTHPCRIGHLVTSDVTDVGGRGNRGCQPLLSYAWSTERTTGNKGAGDWPEARSEQNWGSTVAPLPWEIRSKTPSGYLKPQMVPISVYAMFSLCIHMYDKA